jgi:hypothetical protein
LRIGQARAKPPGFYFGKSGRRSRVQRSYGLAIRPAINILGNDSKVSATMIGATDQHIAHAGGAHSVKAVLGAQPYESIAGLSRDARGS